MASIRTYVERLRHGKSGRRFLDLYEFRRQHPPTPMVRVGLWLMALALIGGGLAIGWLPGPGGFIAVFGLAIVAMEFRSMATILDWLETVGRKAWARLRGQKSPVRGQGTRRP